MYLLDDHGTRRVPTIDDLRVKLCYICREEERYDAPENPPRTWTHPCRCTLVAHESCLLQWIQSSQQTRSRAPNALKCPQCSSPYVLESNNPIILRLLDAANKGLSAIGKIVTVASMYILCTTYGAYALREFLGPEMFDILLSDDPARWPWHSFINLPLIPLSLIMSRLPTKSSITPLVPVLLAWPTSTPIRANDSIILDGWRNPFFRTDPREFLHPLPRWPPPPMILGLFVFPAVRQAYKRMLGNFTRWLLNSNTPHGQDMQRVLNGNDDEPPGQQGLDANNDNEANAPAGDAVAAAENTIRVSGTSLGRLIGGALIIPRISSFMGSLLLRLSKHSKILRKILAVRPPLPTGVVPPAIPRSLFNGKAWSEMSLLKRISYVGYLGLTVAWRGTMTWAECDPVWSVEKFIGFGVFVMAKDCVHLLHLWLTKRELESRRVKNRSFEDVDVQELDLINPSVYS
ncbi:hypothetical protein BKA82DRAFT_4186023 [Pisolithus tinctorius]|nr:hypothetical protein BKA82DRAFT_4186023 [Pisolithus tinctorius]